MVDRKWMILSNTSLAVLTVALDASTTVIALPTIGKQLPDTSALDIVWDVPGASYTRLGPGQRREGINRRSRSAFWSEVLVSTTPTPTEGV